jgi:small conductance mechanosensitive channel
MLLIVLNFAILAQAAQPIDLTIVAPEAAQVIAETPATSQPSTQSVQEVKVTIETDNTPRTLVDQFNESELGELFQGKKSVTVKEMMTINFWKDTIQDLVRFIFSAIPRVLAAILFILIFWLIYRGVRRLVVGSMNKAHVDQSIRDMLSAIVKYAIMGFGLVIACNQVGVQITALLTGVSIIGIAIGFAAQETLANFIAGVVIFWDKPFKIGDWIEFDGQLAQVNRVTFRSTRLNNLDNDVVVVPNTMILAQKFVNKSTNVITRASIPVGIAYNVSIDKARDVLLSTVQNDPRIVAEPEPMVEVRALNASSVDLMLHFWIKEEKYEDAMVWEFLEKAKKSLDAANIEIPFPHVQLLVSDTPAIEKLAGKVSTKNN